METNLVTNCTSVVTWEWDEKRMKERREYNHKVCDGIFGFDGYVHCLYCGDGLCQNLSNCTL